MTDSTRASQKTFPWNLHRRRMKRRVRGIIRRSRRRRRMGNGNDEEQKTKEVGKVTRKKKASNFKSRQASKQTCKYSREHSSKQVYK